MPSRQKSGKTKQPIKAIGLPNNRPPTHPGEMLLEEFLKPLKLTQTEFADRIKIPYARLNKLVTCKRPITADTAVRLERVLGMPATYWLKLQLNWNLWHAYKSPNKKEIDKLKPIQLLT